MLMLKKSFIIIIILILTLFSNNLFAATLSGDIYDSSLNQVDKAIVEITPPLQRDIITNGSYFFELIPGTYNLSVSLNTETRTESTIETIRILDNNQKYVRDLFLFQNLDDEKNLELNTEISIEGFGNNKQLLYPKKILIISFLLIILIIILFIGYKKHVVKKEIIINNEDVKDDYNKDFKVKLIKILKSNEGRMTQKELRKEIPYSESKISLLISELESEGKISKIKKGRGNIIIIK